MNIALLTNNSFGMFDPERIIHNSYLMIIDWISQQFLLGNHNIFDIDSVGLLFDTDTVDLIYANTERTELVFSHLEQLDLDLNIPESIDLLFESDDTTFTYIADDRTFVYDDVKDYTFNKDTGEVFIWQKEAPEEIFTAESEDRLWNPTEKQPIFDGRD